MKTSLALLIVSTSALAQTSAPQKPTLIVPSGQLGANVTATGTSNFLIDGVLPFHPVVGHPYSAEQVFERVQTLADGTHIRQTTQTTKLYRDSAGRTRTERTFPPPLGAVAAGPSFIEITDPVAGYRYVLNERNQTARRMVTVIRQPNPAPLANPPKPAILPATVAAFKADSTRPHPETSRESLGTQVIEGVLAEGMRFTTTYPVGLMGNDRPITTVSEMWTSPDLKMVILSKRSDPRNGDTTTKLTNIVMAEPDPGLFQVPADYSIVDEQPTVVR